MQKIRHFKTVEDLENMSIEQLHGHMDKQLVLHMLYKDQKYLARHSKAKRILDKKLLTK